MEKIQDHSDRRPLFCVNQVFQGMQLTYGGLCAKRNVGKREVEMNEIQFNKGEKNITFIAVAGCFRQNNSQIQAYLRLGMYEYK